MTKIPILASIVFALVLGAALFISPAAPVALGEEANQDEAVLQETEQVSAETDGEEANASGSAGGALSNQVVEEPASIFELFLSHVPESLKTEILEATQNKTALQAFEERLQILQKIIEVQPQ